MSVVVSPAALPTSTITNVINPLSTSKVANFEDSYHRRLAYSSGPYNASAVHLAKQARLLLCQKDSSASIWRILPKPSPPSVTEDGQAEEQQSHAEGGYEPLLDLELNVNTNLVASAISDDGQWVVVSDWYESKLFRLEKQVSPFSDILENNSLIRCV